MATDSTRTLVLCFDGTAGMFTPKVLTRLSVSPLHSGTHPINVKNTNVVKLFGLLEKDDQARQLCYYQSGVGTYTNPGRKLSLDRISRLTEIQASSPL
jgi:uncharacterized protein (DUF2235 family)